MKEIILLRGKIAIIDENDFASISLHKWYLNQYPTTRINGSPICLHVFLLGRAPKGHHIDHINRDKFDNRRCNLRVVTARENLRNRRTYSGCENPFSGRKHSEHTKHLISTAFAKHVKQLTRDGLIVAEYESTLSAEKHTGISNGNISSVCQGKRKTAGGFKWLYA